ncbi:antibiotic biosynthesis monooxygenase (ABM) superfamily enzyme [Azospirillum agricola]|uniref:antibiotic biosynthesis monooxygenase n=1 Tax=Azospirillum agricola TaxID=1720247 RepID=UPI001AEAD1CA|nr:antibiotic biosynthesis monooxygenase [Azospirillum agricola]MBP2232774.1 antibiotic biosynthesis monooxygenase (ABM) superfamily enzyme [Azospirillum agricola]
MTAASEEPTPVLRCAFFRGRVSPGREAEFEALLAERLVPLWRRFPGALEVRLLRPLDADDHAPPLALVLSVRYPSLRVMREALASDIRERTREPTRDLLAMFEGEVFHATFAVDEHGTVPYGPDTP